MASNIFITVAALEDGYSLLVKPDRIRVEGQNDEAVPHAATICSCTDRTYLFWM